MLYKRKILCNGIERIRNYHKPLDCAECDQFQNGDTWCGGFEKLVDVFQTDGCLYLATRGSLCTLLKQSLYYEEE